MQVKLIIKIFLNDFEFQKKFSVFKIKRRYLTASAFARLQSVSGFPGRVSIMSLFNYTMRKVWLQQTRIGLSLYDSTGVGLLRESVKDC